MLKPMWVNDETSPFLGSYRKLDRAKQHLGELRGSMEGYISRKPYSVRQHQEVEGDTIIVWLSVNEPVPVHNWALTIGDTVHNLRSTLDLLACSLVRLENEAANCEWTAFPIFHTAQAFGKKAKDKIRGVHPEAFALIAGLQPYGGGNDLFYQLSMLDNIDKHRLLVPTVALPHSYTFGQKAIAVVEGGRVEIDLPGHIAFEDGATLQRLRPINCSIYPEVDMDSDVTLQIVFGETGISDGVPILEFLSEATNLIEGVLKRFSDWGFWEYGHLSLRVLQAKASTDQS